jgi:HSP20 family protein
MRVPVRREPPDDRPDSDFGRLRDRLLADLERWPELLAQSRRTARPHAAVEETPEAYLVDVDLPGVPAADVHVEIADGQLVVTARRPGTHHVVPERSGTARRLQLALALPPDVLPDAISGALELGVLHLRLPRTPALQPRRIAVRRRQG